MGRKIPGKKHRGVKDPEKQRNKRLRSLKGKINTPPSNPDLQEVPHSVNRIAELKEQAKRKGFKKSEKELSVTNYKSNSNIKPKTKKKKKEVAYKQTKGESDRQFLQRVQRACDAVIQEKSFENKYGVDIKRNIITGEVEKLVKRPKDEIEQLLKSAQKAQKSKKSKKKKKKEIEGPVLTKSQKRSKKLKERKQKKLGTGEFVDNQDVVKFGEVAHEPPSLTIPKKAAKLHGAARPGERNLLLKSVIQGAQVEGKDTVGKNQDNLKKTINKAIDKSGKRKNLPNALRRRLEKQQTEVINAYRALKKQKVSVTNT